MLSHPVHYPKPKTVSFTMEDAKRAKIASKDNWVNHPRAMLRAASLRTASGWCCLA